MLVEYPATIEDFFSEEKDSSSNESDEDSDNTPRSGGLQRLSVNSAKKKKKKKKATGPDHSLPTVDITHKEFRKRGKELIDFIANYMEGTRDQPASVNVHPGFLFRKLPKSAPKDGTSFDALMSEVNNLILPGVPRWQNPGHHGLMPLGASYASLLGSLLCDGLGCASLTWNECPASVELEMVVMNWLAELMDLPLDFHFFGKTQTNGRRRQSTNIAKATGWGAGGGRGSASVGPSVGPGSGSGSANRGAGAKSASKSSSSGAFVGGGYQVNTNHCGGGGIILSSTIECLLTVMTAAKRIMLDTLSERISGVKESELLDKMVAYCSEQAHPGLERVCEIVGVVLKRVWTDRQGIMHCNTLKSVVEKDRGKGYVPFIIVATAGTIASASVDQIDEIGPFDLILVTGTRNRSVGLVTNAQKFGFISMPAMLGALLSVENINLYCMASMVKKIQYLTHTFACEDPHGPLTIPSDDKNNMADYRQWGIPMMRRFKAIKLWTVFKLYGFKNLQQKIREDVRRAKELERVMHDDHRFEILSDTMFGIVTFRCKRPDNNDINREILQQINRSLIINMTGARVGNKFWLRFVVAGRYTTSEDVLYSWEMIKRATSEVTTNHTEKIHNDNRSGMPNFKHVIDIGKEERLDELDPMK